jgi:hypothetical protein
MKPPAKDGKIHSPEILRGEITQITQIQEVRKNRAPKHHIEKIRNQSWPNPLLICVIC